MPVMQSGWVKLDLDDSGKARATLAYEAQLQLASLTPSQQHAVTAFLVSCYHEASFSLAREIKADTPQDRVASLVAHREGAHHVAQKYEILLQELKKQGNIKERELQ